MFKKYKRKPVIMEAIQYDGTEEMADKISAEDGFSGVLDYRTGKFGDFYVYTLNGKVKVRKGDYIMRGIKGEYYPCDPHIFNETYEETEE